MTSPVYNSIKQMPTANETYQARYKCLKGVFNETIHKIETAVTSALTYKDRYADAISRITDFSSVQNDKNPITFDKLKKTYTGIKSWYDFSKKLQEMAAQELKFNIGQSVPVYSKNDSNLAAREKEQKEMAEIVQKLSQINQQFAQRIIPFRDQTNNYMHIVKEGCQLTSWNAGILFSADYYGLDGGEPVAKKEETPVKQEEEKKSTEAKSYAQVIIGKSLKNA